ncbi:2Fe-2S iron-sulfur cluster-binding protein [Agrobacterium vitis]|uniref:2Fe-2S iron-sulfur cluster-binding protein n=1 Tax=Agrobacterium vitis TaxID=373 RepID=UPI0012E81979|nr:2Fe-2S iron-sulfur cluster-binding protein [Agrobacterium vitis]MVA37128.1 2Fe-2S iron-sulfur cluster binding domain-containing protein [Agrobacterium vitis]
MNAGIRDFIDNATLLFIASKSLEGTLDVSPRGGQPRVLWPDDQGRLLLPDYMGNRRLDTISNLLGNPGVALAVLSRGADYFLKIHAHAHVSTAPEDIGYFPADQNRPMSAIVLTPTVIELVESEAFGRAGFWLDAGARKPPLDMMGYYWSDKAMHKQAGRPPITRPTVEEVRLVEAGIREIYGTPSEVVQTKVYDAVGQGGLDFIGEAGFIVLASETAEGEIRIDIMGDAPLELDPTANRQNFRLRLPKEASGVRSAGECAVIAAVPGRCEALRINGPYRPKNSEPGENRTLEIAPDEIFFHCSAALTRSQFWVEPRPASWTGLRRFTITDTRQENPEVKSFVLSPCDLAPIGEILPGQYVTIGLPYDPSVPPRRRNYSVSGRPGEQAIRLTVRKVAEDGFSGLLHTLGAGQEVQVSVPSGRFVLKSPPKRPVMLVSAGVGITPLLPMAKLLVEDCDDREIWFVHAARDARYHLFAEEVLGYAERSGGQLRVISVYSRAAAEEPCDHRGRIDAALLNTLMPARDADFYICGPDEFMSSLRDGLMALGASPESIHHEAFAPTSGGLAEKLADLPDRKITFAQSGKELTWTPSSGTLLDLALSNQIKVDYSCRNGDCQSCVQKLVSGSADYPIGDVPVLAEGQVLLCQAVPKTDLVIGC